MPTLDSINITKHRICLIKELLEFYRKPGMSDTPDDSICVMPKHINADIYFVFNEMKITSNYPQDILPLIHGLETVGNPPRQMSTWSYDMRSFRVIQDLCKDQVRKEINEADMKKKIDFIHAHITAWYDQQRLEAQDKAKAGTFLTEDI